MFKTETLRNLEFDRILATTATFAHSDVTREEIEKLAPLAGRSDIERRFGMVEEVRSVSRIDVPLRLAQFHDIRPILEEVRPEGAVINPDELVPLVPVLQIIDALVKQMAYRSDIPLLRELAGGLTGFPSLLARLERTIDSEGNILDSASYLLSDLRGRKRGLVARIRRRLEEVVREKQVAIFLQDDFITQRAGRWVIPVRMDSKGMVQGVVHDVSNSGETAFMEPLEIIPLANELENLIADEKAEMIRIIRAICAEIRDIAVPLADEFHVLVQLDLLNSIASFAELLNASVPQMGEPGAIRLRGARHPILMLMQREGGVRQVVPLDLELGADGNRVMVITGPNTGGKTIAIKTVGLLLIMALTGIPVPADASSVFPVAERLLVDIGDEQSIEQSLSTFSAHIANIAGILGAAGSRAVVLIDELGTGTDPAQGAAIACGVLQELLKRGALVFATTHLTDIVTHVHRTGGMVNASMEFDQASYTPLYRLKSGEPGQSHALEIARRYGLPEHILEFARGMMGRREAEFHELLAELKSERLKYETLRQEEEQKRQRLEERERQLVVRIAEAESARREAMGKSWQEAKEVIAQARRQTRDILEETRREKEKGKAALKQLEELETEAEKKEREFTGEKPLAISELHEGDVVFVRSLGFDATIVKISEKQGRLRVRARGMEVEVPLSDLSRGKGKPQPPSAGRGRRGVEEREVSNELKLLGMRVDDALAELERFLNDASLASMGELRIVHGTGTGALMRAVRQYVDGHPLVASFRPGEQMEGGNGVTIVTLR